MVAGLARRRGGARRPTRRFVSWSSRRVIERPSTSCIAIASGSSSASRASRCGSTSSRSSIGAPGMSADRSTGASDRSRRVRRPWPTTQACSPTSRPRKPTSTPSSPALDDAGLGARRPRPRAGTCATRSPTSPYAEELATTAAHRPRRVRRAARRADRRPRGDPDGLDRCSWARGGPAPGAEVLAWWRTARARHRRRAPRPRAARRASRGSPGPMSAMSFATARLMETWAHGQDVADGLGVRRVADRPAPPRRRPRRPHPPAFATAVRGLRAPRRATCASSSTAPTAPPGRGASPTTDTVRGPALDFCLVVTQRRHPTTPRSSDGRRLAHASGSTIAQAFAGPLDRPAQRPPPEP